MPERGRWSIALMPNRRFSGTVLAWMLSTGKQTRTGERTTSFPIYNPPIYNPLREPYLWLRSPPCESAAP